MGAIGCFRSSSQNLFFFTSLHAFMERQ